MIVRAKLHGLNDGQWSPAPFLNIFGIRSPLTEYFGQFYASIMEIPFTPAQETELARLARQQGRSVQDVVVGAALKELQTEGYFLEKLDRAIAQADSGEFIEEEEMDVRIEKMLARS